MEVAPPGVESDGTGGAKNLMKDANFSIELMVLLPVTP
jgi:hypothetical protein